VGVDRIAEPPAQQTEQYCLSCHGDPDLKMTLPSGAALAGAFATSPQMTRSTPMIMKGSSNLGFTMRRTSSIRLAVSVIVVVAIGRRRRRRGNQAQPFQKI
jgi:hypothetical protein